MNTTTQDRPSTRRIDRRTVIRAGAWTVPVISLAVAAPALAASGTTTGVLLFDTFNGYGAVYNNAGRSTMVESQVQVQNVYVSGGPTLSSISVTVSYPAGSVTGDDPTIVSGSGWVFVSASKSAQGVWSYTFTYSGSTAPGRSTTTLDYRVPRTGTAAGVLALTAVAIASGATMATAAAVATV